MLYFKRFGIRDNRIYDPNVCPELLQQLVHVGEARGAQTGKLRKHSVESDQCDSIIISAKRGQAQLVDFIVRNLLQCPKEVDLKRSSEILRATYTDCSGATVPDLFLTRPGDLVRGSRQVLGHVQRLFRSSKPCALRLQTCTFSTKHPI